MRLLPKNSELGWTPYAWLLYTVPYLVALYKNPQGPLELAGHLGAYVAFLILYFVGYWVHGRRLVLVIAGMALIGGALSFTPFRFYGASFFIYAAAMIPFIDRDRPRLTYLAIYLGLVAGFGVASGQQFWFFVPAVFIAGVIGGLNIHWAQVFISNAKLRLAHSEVEHLAKIAERERIARDLHDVLGHTLSVIALKSELASKLMERDPGRAAREIREVNEVARDALAQVRSAVTGYRASGLSAEFEAMRKAFETAGVSLSVETEPLNLPPAHENALTMVLREATTNVLRHARAKTCKVRLALSNNVARLEIEDDGAGGDGREGNGLTGMRERVAALGGSLVRDGRSGTRLEITLPLSPEPA
ncbi:MAG: sensor histidine kinase [Vicinamibacteria bacterium]|nr:sensor histidine kinase [Vicinamibacteria bacterium]